MPQTGEAPCAAVGRGAADLVTQAVELWQHLPIAVIRLKPENFINLKPENVGNTSCKRCRRSAAACRSASRLPSAAYRSAAGRRAAALIHSVMGDSASTRPWATRHPLGHRRLGVVSPSRAASHTHIAGPLYNRVLGPRSGAESGPTSR